MLKLFSQNATHNRKSYERKPFSSLCRHEKMMLAGLRSLCIVGNIQTQPWACALHTLWVDMQNTGRPNSLPVRWALSVWLDTLPWPSGLRNVVKDRNVFRIEKEEEGRSFWKNNTGSPELVLKCAPVAVNGQKINSCIEFCARLSWDGCVRALTRLLPPFFCSTHSGPFLLGRWGNLLCRRGFAVKIQKRSHTVLHNQDGRN